MATLTIHALRKRFGAVEVLKGIDIEARTGEFIALVGPSGCGKSTLLAMIAGLESVSEGEIRIDGRLVNGVAPKDRDIAMVFQSYALYPTMTARQNITFGMESRGVPKAEQDAAVKRVAALLQIDRATMMAITNTLLGRGLLEKGASETDRRRRTLHLTPAGSAALVTARKAVADHEDWLKSRFSAEEVTQLVGLLSRIHG